MFLLGKWFGKGTAWLNQQKERKLKKISELKKDVADIEAEIKKIESK